MSHNLSTIDDSVSELKPRRDTHILLVEDNYINQEVALNMLESEGFNVDITENGQEALDYLKNAKFLPDLILMDMQMPIMDGITATHTIRKSPEWQKVPIIAMTANAMDEDKQACIAAGMNDHLAKPFEKKNLIEMIDHYTSSKTS